MQGRRRGKVQVDGGASAGAGSELRRSSLWELQSEGPVATNVQERPEQHPCRASAAQRAEKAPDLPFAWSDTRAERLWQALTRPRDQVDRTAGGAEDSPTVPTVRGHP